MREEFGQKVVFLMQVCGKQQGEIAEAIGVKKGNLRNYLIKRIKASGKQLTKMLGKLNAAFAGLLKRWKLDKERTYTDYMDNPPSEVEDQSKGSYSNLKDTVGDQGLDIKALTILVLRYISKSADRKYEDLLADLQKVKDELSR